MERLDFEAHERGFREKRQQNGYYWLVDLCAGVEFARGVKLPSKAKGTVRAGEIRKRSKITRNINKYHDEWRPFPPEGVSRLSSLCRDIEDRLIGQEAVVAWLDEPERLSVIEKMYRPGFDSELSYCQDDEVELMSPNNEEGQVSVSGLITGVDPFKGLVEIQSDEGTHTLPYARVGVSSSPSHEIIATPTISLEVDTFPRR